MYIMFDYYGGRDLRISAIAQNPISNKDGSLIINLRDKFWTDKFEKWLMNQNVANLIARTFLMLAMDHLMRRKGVGPVR